MCVGFHLSDYLNYVFRRRSRHPLPPCPFDLPLSTVSSIGHSAFSDMETIEQSAPASAEPLGRRGADLFSRRDEMDEFELGFSSKTK